MILLFTNKEDCHPTPVIDKLQASGVKVFRFNTECLLKDYTFSWQAGESGNDFTIRCKNNGLTLRGSDVTAIWDRRPEAPLPLFENTPEIDKHNKAEALEFLAWLRYWLKDIPSLGSIVMDRPAASKLLQYRTAIEVGFNIPKTIFSNSKDSVCRFANGAGELSLKEICGEGMMAADEEQQYVFYTQKATPPDLLLAPDEAFAQTVSFIQEYIPKAYELRVTLVGDKCFAAKVYSQTQADDTGKTDWRQGSEHGLRWYVCEDYPNREIEKCQVFLKRMNLNFGCFDFIVTPNGDYVFLECNPNGQWLWIELETGMNISGAIANWLISYECK